VRDQVRLLLERAVRAGLVPGAVAAWQAGDQAQQVVVTGSAALVPARRPLSASVWFDLSSLTKPLATTTLTLIALREHGLELSTTVGEVLAQARRGPLAQVTLQHLLTHSSGLPAWAPTFAWGDPATARLRLLRTPLSAAPGSSVVYSCLGFLVLGMVLEEVFDEPLDRSFRTLVQQPLALAGELDFRPDPHLHQLAAGGLVAGAERRLLAELGLDPALIPPLQEGLPDDGNARFFDGVAGNAGLFGTAGGVLTLARQYLPEHSRLLTAAEIERATTCYTPGGEQHRALGWQCATSPGCAAGPGIGAKGFGHVGYTGTSVWLDPVERLRSHFHPEHSSVLVLLAHRNHPSHRELDLHPLRRRFNATACVHRERRPT
jgi:CubicO group peptidase (beta-lactamase class C family)